MPPVGVEPWDWERTWLAWPGTTKLLTVSKEEKDGGKYHTINDALAVAKPWDAIHVLDAQTYEEALSFTDKSKHEGIRLEAPNGATLQMTANMKRLLTIRSVPHVQVSGFRWNCTGRGEQLGLRQFVHLSGDVSGVTLMQLRFMPGDLVQTIVCQDALAAPDGLPLCVRHCLVKGTGKCEGILVVGSLASKGTRGVQVADCQLDGMAGRGVAVIGLVRDVQVVGNRIGRSNQAGLQLENVYPDSAGILLANNTVVGCNCNVRVWEDPPYPEHTPGQVELANNLFADALETDIGLIQSKDLNAVVDPVPFLRLWRFRGNYRDLSGGAPSRVLPLAPEERRLTEADRESLSVDTIGHWRPKSQSDLGTKGVGGRDGSLPVYAGALPPEGVEAWN